MTEIQKCPPGLCEHNAYTKHLTGARRQNIELMAMIRDLKVDNEQLKKSLIEFKKALARSIANEPQIKADAILLAIKETLGIDNAWMCSEEDLKDFAEKVRRGEA